MLPALQQAFEPPKATLLGALAMTLAVLLLAQHFGPLGRPVLAVAGSYLLASLAGLAPFVSWYGVPVHLQGTLFVLGCIVFGAAIAALPTRAHIDRVFMATAAAGTLASLYGLAQHFGYDLISWQRSNARPSSTFGNPDLLALFLAMSLPLTVHLALRHRAVWPAVLAQAACLFFTQSRGGWLGAAVGLLAFAGIHHWRVVVAGAALLLLGAVLLAFQPGRTAASTDRLQVWTAALHLSAQRPLLGYGPETLGAIMPHSPAEGVDARTDRSHNWVLDALVQRGIVGLAADVWLLVATVCLAIRTGTTRSLAALAAVLAGSAAALVDWVPVAPMVLAWALTGVIAADARQPEAEPVRRGPYPGGRQLGDLLA